MKRCPDCQLIKPLDDFPPAARRRDGRGTYCRQCMRARSQANYRKRAEERGRMVRERADRGPDDTHQTCPDCGECKPLEAFPRNRNSPTGRHNYCKPCHNARGKESKERLYGGTSYYHRRRRYGLAPGEFEEMLAAQGNVCAVCRERPGVHLDHDHESGDPRGILCFGCNGGLGQFRDRVDILRAAIDYLDRSRDNRGTA